MLLIFGSTLSSFAIEDAIIAVVNDELITLKDLKDYVRSTYVSLVAEGVPEDQLKTIMADLEVNGINKLIEDKLILSKANDIGIIIREKLIDDRIEEVKSKYSSEKEFLDALIQNGATLTDLRTKILNQLKIKFVINHEIRSRIHVTPQEVTEFYEQNIEYFKENEKAKLDSIHIAFGDDAPNARKKAEEALKLLKEGEDFNTIAKQFSDTPSIGTIERGQMLPVLEQSVFSLNEEEISSLIEVANGIFIFKLLEKIPAQNAPLEEVKDKITDVLEKKQFEEKILAWIEKLKEKAYIEIKR